MIFIPLTCGRLQKFYLNMSAASLQRYRSLYGNARAVRSKVSTVTLADQSTTIIRVYKVFSTSANTASTADLMLATASTDAIMACGVNFSIQDVTLVITG